MSLLEGKVVVVTGGGHGIGRAYCMGIARESGAVIVADIDEFLYHPDMLGYLGRWRNRGATCIPALGYEMVSDSFPAPGETLAATAGGTGYFTISEGKDEPIHLFTKE